MPRPTALLVLLLASPLPAADWPTWGHDPSRNMVAPPDEKNLPTDISADATPNNLKWSARHRPPVTLRATDADLLWRYDLRKELGVLPLFQTAGSVLIVGDRLSLSTCTGHDPQITRPAPDAPQLICLDKNTGKLLGQERS